MKIPQQIRKDWTELAARVNYYLQRAADRASIGNTEAAATAVTEARRNSDRLSEALKGVVS